LDMQKNDPPVVLMAATMWWPLSAKLAIALKQSGCVVSAICPAGHPLRCVEGIHTLYSYRRIGSLKSLERAIREAAPAIIVPCDDGVVWQLHDLHRLRPDLRPLIQHSLGSAQMYPVVHSRAALLATAAELGVRIPRTATIASEQDLASWCARSSLPVVLKLDGTWGGEGVQIAPSKEHAAKSYRRMARPTSLATCWKRFLINRDPLALWAWRAQQRATLTAQEFIAGRPANTMFFAWRGEVLAIVAVEVLCAQGATGAATIVRLIDNEEILHAATSLAKHLELSGFHGLDFILEQATGAAYLLEMNPRCTQLGHLALPGKGSLARAMYTQLSGDRDAPIELPIDRDQVAFFPQALVWNSKSSYLRTSYHDVPWEELALVHELLRVSWPSRRILARIYDSLRKPRQVETVEFAPSILEHNES
jgi:hypothetical protein